MPRCKNANTGTYKGTEPSPKGLGYCARGEKIGKKKKGLDGNMWIVKETKKGTARWVKITKTNKSTKKESDVSKNKSAKKTTKSAKKKKSEVKKKKSNDTYIFKVKPELMEIDTNKKMSKSEFDKNFNAIVKWFEKYAFMWKNMKIDKKENPYFFVSVVLENDKYLNQTLQSIENMFKMPDDEGNYLFKKKYFVGSSNVSLVESKIKSKPIKKWDTKKIIVHKNKKIYTSRNKISISNNNLIYLSFSEKGDMGRIYFSLKNLKNTKEDVIKDLKLDKKKQTFEFRYHGDWEDEKKDKFKIIKVNDKWKVVFEDKKEFDKMEGFVKQFDIVKIIN